MCSRYELNSPSREIMQAFDLPDVPVLQNQAEIRPTDIALILQMGRQATTQGWGFNVDWTTQPMINARAESLAEKPTFKPWLNSRCIVPATAYFEWRTDETGKKCKNRIWLANDNVFGIAGLTNGERFTIATTTPSPAIAHIHSRMPVVLSDNDLDIWLSDAPFEDVAHTLQPYGGIITFDEEKPPPPAQRDLFG